MKRKLLVYTICALGAVGVMITLQSIQAATYAPAQGWCEQGGQVVITGGVASTTKVQRSYPPCTVTVYVNGSGGVKATIYSSRTGVAQSNPFTSGANGFWQFYANNGRYDVQLSGGGLPIPTTIGDVLLFDPQISTLVTTNTPQTITAIKTFTVPQIFNGGTSGEVTLGNPSWIPTTDGVVILGSLSKRFGGFYLNGTAELGTSTNWVNRSALTTNFGVTVFPSGSTTGFSPGSTLNVNTGSTFLVNGGGTGEVTMGNTQWAPTTDAIVDLGVGTSRGFNRLFLSGAAEFKGNINARGSANNFYGSSLTVFRTGATLQTLTGSNVTMDNGTTFLLNSGGAGEVTMGNTAWTPTTSGSTGVAIGTSSKSFGGLWVDGPIRFNTASVFENRSAITSHYGVTVFPGGSTVGFSSGSTVNFNNGVTIVPPTGTTVTGTITCGVPGVASITISQGLVTGVTCN